MKTAVANSIIPETERMAPCKHGFAHKRWCATCWLDMQRQRGFMRGKKGPRIVRPKGFNDDEVLVPDKEREERKDPNEDKAREWRFRDPADAAFDEPERRPQAARKPVEKELIPPEFSNLEPPEDKEEDEEATRAAIADATGDAATESQLHPILETPLLPLSPEESTIKSKLSKLPLGHTALEISEALERMVRDGWTPYELAEAFKKTVVWVYQYLSLTRLTQKVRDLMNPELPDSKRLKFYIAVALAHLEPQLQEKLAQEVMASGLRGARALQFIRQRTQQEKARKEAQKRLSPTRELSTPRG